MPHLRRFGDELVADEGELGAIGRPGGDVDGALAAEKFGEDGDFLSGQFAVNQRYDPEHYVFVFWMAGDFFLVGEENHLLAIGGEVREPIVEVVEGDLLLLAAIGMHAPDLHVAGALGIEINVFAIG